MKGVERGWLEGCHIIIACGNLFMNSAAKIALFLMYMECSPVFL